MSKTCHVSLNLLLFFLQRHYSILWEMCFIDYITVLCTGAEKSFKKWGGWTAKASQKAKD